MVLLAMGPKQKKRSSKPDEPVPAQPAPHDSSIQRTATQESAETASSSKASTEALSVVSTASLRPERSNTTSKTDPRSPNRWSYYGSWRTSSKSSPVTQSTNESISVQQGTTSESSESTTRRPSQALSRGMRSSRKSIPVIAEPTRIHATSDASDKSKARLGSEEKLKGFDPNTTTEKRKTGESDDKSADPIIDDARSVGSAETLKPPSNQQQGSGWFGWWSRPDDYEKPKEGSDKADDQAAEVASSTPLPTTPTDEPVSNNAKDTPGVDSVTTASTDKTGLTPPGKNPYNASYRSWFGLWSSAQNELAAPADPTKKNDDQKAAPAPPQVTVSSEPEDVENVTKQKDGGQINQKKDGDESRPKSSGWAFWSMEKKGEATLQPDGTQKQVGELAVADTPSQSHPEAAQFNEQRSKVDKPDSTVSQRTGSLLGSKRSKQKDRLEPESGAVTPSVSQIPSPAGPSTPTVEEPPKPVPRGRLPQIHPNVISPTFSDTYPLATNPGYVERASNYVWWSLRLQNHLSRPPVWHVLRDPQHPPKIKKAIAIGIHGFFPTPLIQKVLGQPTGTSIRFANYAAAAIHSWCKDRQPDVKDVEVEKVALEGEGFIADRVTTLWKLLLNWLSHLRQADFIFLACHSQGVPVTLMLLAKLIQLGPLNPNVKIGVCAMAGVNLGPFVEYKSRLFGGAALELFDFADSRSAVSKAYTDALDVCLRAGVRVSYIGSLDDQLVSLESALNMPLAHPYVNRAVFIDGRLHVPNFLNHLVILALKLKNLGVRDHGLIRELSAPLAGSLVGGDGHSRVYDDAAVYRLALDFALESTDFTPPAPANSHQSQLASTPQHQHHKSATLTTKDVAFARRSATGGVPVSTTAAANSIRRGSFSTPSTTHLPGIAPVYEPSSAKDSGVSTPNPFYLPWAVRGLLSEDLVKQDEKLSQEVKDLVAEFEEWKPTSKVLKDVRWRLEGVRSLV
ncbi:hypothetical protein K431DRAFT_321510 [Polychaeton citri CBS 116435]|uniref:YMC020W-like alpha/beta hydrolase domain-containing protein n=1 Tax=Polychaeton citri CBS 116435 TaxID=1314669 RepID=A0A9P4UP94_9PEZI|nr:hypothetical protein K431DRAFT_321510 [Polychaeton citri CBS 116435]